MNKKNTEKLFKEFKFFRPEKSPRKSLMCFGIETGDGWFDLIYRLCRDIQKVLDDKGIEDFEVLQVKEKFGGLRFYVTSAPMEIHDLINRAEGESYKTCEECGKPGKLRGGSWVKTRCEECENA